MTSYNPNFDRVARAYRWMEYLSLGTTLERTRRFHLDSGLLDNCRRALVLGDGDGRFTARLLRRNPCIQVDAVDLSAEMLRLLRRRCEFASHRLRIHQADARSCHADESADLVVTHFFLDCLTEEEVYGLVQRVAPTLAPHALWLVSEFRIPNGLLKWPALALVRGLYLAFRLLTGLRVNRLPDQAAALHTAGFRTIAEMHFLGGILTTQLWQRET
jgi:ubiquinone/menaquinone biosynthesis C-methylase UbiE